MHRIPGNAPYFGHFRQLFDFLKSFNRSDLRKYDSPIYFAHHDIEAAQDRENVGEEGAAGEFVECT